MTSQHVLASLRRPAFLLLLAAALLGSVPDAQVGSATRYVEVDGDSGGFEGLLQAGDRFGSSVCAFGDLDGDGLSELAIGAGRPLPGAGALTSGSVWIVYPNADGTIRDQHEIGPGLAGFEGVLGNDAFGSSVAALGDLNGDGVPDLAVGAEHAYRTLPQQDREMGNLWILFLDGAGQVLDEVRITSAVGGFSGFLRPYAHLGSALAPLGDLGGDGSFELAIGASGLDEGSVFVASLAADGTVQGQVRIAEGRGGFGGDLSSGSDFGIALASIGDLDGDGVEDLAVGASTRLGVGSVWILFLDAAGTVRDEQEITVGVGGFGGTLDTRSEFGAAVARLPDLDGDGLPELAVGAPGSGSLGSTWILFLEADGTVRSEVELAAGADGLAGIPSGVIPAAEFGRALWSPGDSDLDGDPELWVGAAGLAFGTAGEAGGAFRISLCESDLVADFEATSASGKNPLTVTFQDQSTGDGISQWRWDFGDGGQSTEQDPVYTYRFPGTYSVRLETTGSAGSCGNSKTDLVIVETTPASLVHRNGSGVNPDVYASSALPILGSTWVATVDGTTLGASGVTVLAGFERPLPGIPTAFGELLVDVTSAPLVNDAALLLSGVATHDLAVPSDTSLSGLAVSTQVYLSPGGTLTNALDLVLGI